MNRYLIVLILLLIALGPTGPALAQSGQIETCNNKIIDLEEDGVNPTSGTLLGVDGNIATYAGILTGAGTYRIGYVATETNGEIVSMTWLSEDGYSIPPTGVGIAVLNPVLQYRSNIFPAGQTFAGTPLSFGVRSATPVTITIFYDTVGCIMAGQVDQSTTYAMANIFALGLGPLVLIVLGFALGRHTITWLQIWWSRL